MTEIQPRPSPTLRKHEEVDVALGADGLELVGQVKVFDQEAAEEVVRLVHLIRDGRLLPHDRAATIGADDESAAHAAIAGVVAVADFEHAEFGATAVARRPRAMECFLSDPELMVVRAVPFVGPDMVPAAAFTDETRARLFAPA